MRLDCQLSEDTIRFADHCVRLLPPARAGQQAAFFKAGQQILLRLPLPQTLTFQRRNIFAGPDLHSGALSHQDAGQFVDCPQGRRR